MLKEIMNKEHEELTTKDKIVFTGYCVLCCGSLCAGIFGGAYVSRKILNKIGRKKNQ